MSFALSVCQSVCVLLTHRDQKKNILDIFDCNSKQDYQILIIFYINISHTTVDQITDNFLPHLLSASALREETKSMKYCIFILFCLFRFFQVVQKQTFDEMRTKAVV